jgi:hypothetical protein
MVPHLIRTLFIPILVTCTFAAAQNHNSAPSKFDEATIAQLQADMASGKVTSLELTQFYITRILLLDQKGPGVNSVIQLNPDVLAQARDADARRRRGATGLLLGIPVLLKDNIDTGDKMQTTAGSFALFGLPALQDSTVAANLRRAGAVILGKTNLSEWANFRSFFSTSGWSGRGGLAHNPYSLDRNACGSSSGSGAAAAANFTAVSLGSAGIDVHKKVLMVVVVDASRPEDKPTRRRFVTMPSELHRLLTWLQEQGVEEVVMESTAQYWRSVWLNWSPTCACIWHRRFLTVRHVGVSKILLLLVP